MAVMQLEGGSPPRAPPRPPPYLTCPPPSDAALAHRSLVPAHAHTYNMPANMLASSPRSSQSPSPPPPPRPAYTQTRTPPPTCPPSRPDQRCFATAPPAGGICSTQHDAVNIAKALSHMYIRTEHAARAALGKQPTGKPDGAQVVQVVSRDALAATRSGCRRAQPQPGGRARCRYPRPAREPLGGWPAMAPMRCQPCARRPLCPALPS